MVSITSPSTETNSIHVIPCLISFNSEVVSDLLPTLWSTFRHVGFLRYFWSHKLLKSTLIFVSLFSIPEFKMCLCFPEFSGTVRVQNSREERDVVWQARGGPNAVDSGWRGYQAGRLAMARSDIPTRPGHARQ